MPSTPRLHFQDKSQHFSPCSMQLQEPTPPTSSLRRLGTETSTPKNPKTGQVFSIDGTSEQSLSQPSSFWPSLHSLDTDGEQKSDAEQRSSGLIKKSISHRPRMSEMQQHQSTSQLVSEDQPAQHLTKLKIKIPRRRCVSADTCNSARARFTSPDRYSALRSDVTSPSSPFRTSRPASELRGRERLQRRRDPHLDLFRSPSKKSLPATFGRIMSRRRSAFAPHYTPSFVYGHHTTLTGTTARAIVNGPRSTSFGTIWSVGGTFAAAPPATQLAAVDTGRGVTLTSGSNAPMLHAHFVAKASSNDKLRAYEGRLALALEIDQAQRVLPVGEPRARSKDNAVEHRETTDWEGTSWVRYPNNQAKPLLVEWMQSMKPRKTVPTVAFRVLDAPHLKDDYYCSVLAYNYTYRTLAVALTHRVYLWTEKDGVRSPSLRPVRPANYVSSMSFSSEPGRRAILAIARNSGHVTLWSLLEQRARFEAPHPWAACSVAFRPTLAYRYSIDSRAVVSCEDLLVGDDSGCVYYYSVEWPDDDSGSMTLLVKLDAHSQNVCGLAWAPDGWTFVSGGNDNNVLSFEVKEILQNYQTAGETSADDRTSRVGNSGLSSRPRVLHGSIESNGLLTPPASPLVADDSRGRTVERTPPSIRQTETLPPIWKDQSILRNRRADPKIAGLKNAHKRSFFHAAAVKAIAFAPWQSTLVATGGGSNDRQIHFYHTSSGTTLAVINVFAQVTSLVWSKTRRELAATFGYAQPEHEVRIAVFAWPSCECVVSIPWERKANGEVGRALWAIAYPGGPNDAASEAKQDTEEDSSIWDAFGTRQALARPNINEDGQMTTAPSRADVRQDRRHPTDIGATSSSPKDHSRTRAEGEVWASRTEEEGSLIIACCDQTVKFFEIWAGKSKGRMRGLGTKEGVLGGSKVLEGWCESMTIEEVGRGEEVIR